MSESSETVTVLPPDLYDELMNDDSEPQPDARLQEAARRARMVITHPDVLGSSS